MFYIPSVFELVALVLFGIFSTIFSKDVEKIVTKLIPGKNKLILLFEIIFFGVVALAVALAIVYPVQSLFNKIGINLNLFLSRC